MNGETRVWATARRVAWLACIVGAIAAFVATFALTSQTPEETTALSQAAERRVAPAAAALSDAGASSARANGTEAGSEGVSLNGDRLLDSIITRLLAVADIRAWAHVPEFFVQGVFLFGGAALWPCGGEKPARHLRTRRLPLRKRLALALACCAACSLFDQTHKAFVPGREFDACDLLFDAAGYLLALALVTLVVGVARGVRACASNRVRHA